MAQPPPGYVSGPTAEASRISIAKYCPAACICTKREIDLQFKRLDWLPCTVTTKGLEEGICRRAVSYSPGVLRQHELPLHPPVSYTRTLADFSLSRSVLHCFSARTLSPHSLNSNKHFLATMQFTTLSLLAFGAGAVAQSVDPAYVSTLYQMRIARVQLTTIQRPQRIHPDGPCDRHPSRVHLRRSRRPAGLRVHSCL